MAFVMGCLLVLVSFVASLGVSAFAGFNTYWPMVILWAAWAAADAKRNDMARYQRVFPLEPLPLFITVLLLWPVALPWYIRLKRFASLGRLPIATGPSRARYVLVAATLALPLAWFGFQRFIGFSPMMHRVETLYQAVAAATQDTITVNLATGGKLSVSVINSSTPVGEVAAREALGRTLATAAVKGRPDGVDLTEVAVVFVSRTDSGGVTVTRAEQEFAWPAAELR